MQPQDHRPPPSLICPLVPGELIVLFRLRKFIAGGKPGLPILQPLPGGGSVPLAREWGARSGRWVCGVKRLPRAPPTLLSPGWAGACGKCLHHQTIVGPPCFLHPLTACPDWPHSPAELGVAGTLRSHSEFQSKSISHLGWGSLAENGGEAMSCKGGAVSLSNWGEDRPWFWGVGEPCLPHSAKPLMYPYGLLFWTQSHTEPHT